MFPFQGQCPLTDEDAEISDVAALESIRVKCPTCTTFLITYTMRYKLASDPEVAKLKPGLSSTVARHFRETKEPLQINEGNFPMLAMWKD